MNRFFFLFLALFLTSCVAGPNPVITPLQTWTCVNPAGFWLGLWHGMILPITFFVSLFTDDVSVYEACNTGGWYDFGFSLGLSGTFGGGSSSAARKST
jgi:hypothetical protein